MPTSQNGYSANDRSVIASYTVPGTTLRIALRKGDVSVVLLEYLRRYHREVESLYHQPQDLWGYAERTIRGSSTTLSNHASGTAIDARAVDHPLGAVGTFTATELHALRRLLAYFEGVLRWGGDYRGRKDEMHAEVVGTPAEVRRIADKIRSGAPSAIPAIPPSSADLPVLRRGSTGHHVEVIQRFLGIAVDSAFGPATERAVIAYQRARGLTADGVVGPATWRATGLYPPPGAAPSPTRREEPELNAEERKLLDEIHAKLHQAHPTRVDFELLDEQPTGHRDDALGYAINADARAYEARELVLELHRKVDELADRPAAAVDVDALVARIADVGIAEQVVDALARRMSA